MVALVSLSVGSAVGADTNAPPVGFLMTAAAPTRTRDDADLARTLEADDASDLVRMDDDGGPQIRVAAGPDRPASGGLVQSSGLFSLGVDL